MGGGFIAEKGGLITATAIGTSLDDSREDRRALQGGVGQKRTGERGTSMRAGRERVARRTAGRTGRNKSQRQIGGWSQS